MEYKEIDFNMLDEMTELFTKSFNAMPWNECWTIKIADKRLSQRMTSEGFYGICAYADNILRGFILGCFEQYYDKIEFVIQEFAVDNSARGKGIGSKIISEFEKRLKEKGVRNITLLTIRGDMTEHFYNRNGFKEAEKMVFMSKKI